jgi:hypothetical protein
MGVATAVALGTTLASAGMSAAQAAKQSRMQKQAEAEAQRAMQEARKRLEVNFYDKLSVKKEPYELAIEAANVAAAEAIQAGQESERGVAATAGRVMMADADQQRKIAAAYGQELMNLEQLSATEDSRLRDVNTQIDLAQAEGAQKAARDAQEAKVAATEAAIDSGISAVGKGIGAAALYGQNKAAQRDVLGQMQMTPEQLSTFGEVKGGERFGFKPASEGVTNLDLEAVGNMNARQYNQFLKALNPTQKAALFQSDFFQKNYKPNPFDFVTTKK